jgi:hypothetical protein
MKQVEAYYKSRWNRLNSDIKEEIENAVNDGYTYVTLNRKLSGTEYEALENLGYDIYFNKATNTHEIRW